MQAGVFYSACSLSGIDKQGGYILLLLEYDFLSVFRAHIEKWLI